MKRRKFAGRELDLLQKLKSENKKLKQQVAQLRKLIDKFDLERYHDVKEIMEANERLEARFQQQEARDKLKATWQCWDCHTGVLRIKTFTRRDGVFYFRCCSNPDCRKRTKMKAYDSTVEGLE